MSTIGKEAGKLRLPLKVQGSGGYGALNGTSIIDDRGLVAAVTIGDVPELSPLELAAFVVKAVNAHDELVAALEKAVQLAEIASDWNLDSVEIDGTMVRTLDLRNEFRAALSRAKGEE